MSLEGNNHFKVSGILLFFVENLSGDCVKGIVHKKNENILSSITHPQVVPNLSDFLVLLIF